ncbi:MAG: hypothetical protein LBE76_01870 [Nitrososphaerota archaeon]|jgi:hypothetical protein|nr:hypothetical protein [Nitrososphaerota archaeon]
MQKLVLQTTPQTTTKLQLTFNIPTLDELFPAFHTGDFAVLYGSENVTSLLSQLCIRAHLPTEQGGLNSNTIFIDAANSSSMSNILQTIEHHQLDPQKTIEHIQTFRAYTAYRLQSLIIEKLEQTIKTSKAKLVIISDIMCPFLTETIDEQETRTAYNQIINYLSNFAKKHNIIIIATNLPHENTTRNKTLHDITTTKTGIILRLIKTQYSSDIELEKHPSYMLGIMDFKPENKLLTDFY